MTRKFQVRDAFAAASLTYDQAAEAQIRAAEALAGQVGALALPPQPRVLEIGCGTGQLTRRLKPLIGGDWLVTDLSPAMVEQARATFTDARFAVMDGEAPDQTLGPFDLIVSNLAVQWFGDLSQALGRLMAMLAPGGVIAFSTLADGSLHEWRHAHRRLGLRDGLMDFPTLDALQAILPPRTQLRPQTFTVTHQDGLAFLMALKSIGAHVPAENHRPLSPGALRKVIRALGSPTQVSYHVVHAILAQE